ncbi:MAG: imidazole glycerol phosphate synthase subunit HisH [Deltaproteobacteria bacterium]|nr:imidazole glycerol phosphate synthase subunit HisH [Deltaproteobacteria bacterium]
MIAIVDTGGANLTSVVNALGRLGVAGSIDELLTSDPLKIKSASHVFLPGVGAAGDAMARLEKSKLGDCLRGLKQPVLGICLGMQILFDRSDEGAVDCLKIMPGRVSRIQAVPGLSVPHMGWNRIRIEKQAKCPLLEGIPDESFFYFIHSFVAPPGKHVVATSRHGGRFPAVVQKDNVFGVQFHPERSSEAGAALLRNFLEL